MELFPYMMGSYSIPRQDRKRFFPEGAIEKLRWSSSYQDDMGPGFFSSALRADLFGFMADGMEKNVLGKTRNFQ